MVGDLDYHYIHYKIEPYRETMADMRELSKIEITMLQNESCEGVELLGYYKPGDTPVPIDYYLTLKDPGPDDGGSISFTILSLI